MYENQGSTQPYPEYQEAACIRSTAQRSSWYSGMG